MKKNNIHLKSAFTLTEVIIVLAILGVIGALILPPLMNNSTENQNRVKVRKALSNYENIVEQMRINEGLITVEGTDKTSLNGFSKGNDYSNGKSYFKIKKEDESTSYIFKTYDNLWWNIKDMNKPIISLTDECKKSTPTTTKTDACYNKSFYLTTELNTTKGNTFIVNEPSGDAKQTLIFAKIIEDSTEISSNNICGECGSSCTLTRQSNCDSSGKNCTSTYVTQYNEDGKMVLSNCVRRVTDQVSCSSTISTYYSFEYDEKGNISFQKSDCDSEGKNCTGDTIDADNKYNEDGSLAASACYNEGGYCYASHIGYEYNEDGSIKYLKTGCDDDGNNCAAYVEYDEYGNKNSYSKGCAGTIESCTSTTAYLNNYKDGKLISSSCSPFYRTCKKDGLYVFEYDASGNIKSQAICDNESKNCTSYDIFGVTCIK